MTKPKRYERYSAEFKREAIRNGDAGRHVASRPRTVGILVRVSPSRC